MTLKELRISKGLNQKDCAQFLGISLRSYQNYENDTSKEDTPKYHALYIELAGYMKQKQDFYFEDSGHCFHTNVATGNALSSFAQMVKSYQTRDCYKFLKKFINGRYDGKIGILYGLRRTGKTTLLFQLLDELPIDKAAYIKAKPTDTMADLSKDLNFLYHAGYKYVFIDEITLLEDFIDTAAILSDLYANMDMKIIVSGTDSLGFELASRDELYDRAIMIHTSFIPYREYDRLLGMHSIDAYIEYGGTLKKENMDFDDPDSSFDDVSFRDEESTRKYIDSAICRNIQHSLKNDHQGEYFNELKELYHQGELTNVINRILESMNHDFLLKVIEEEFRSHDLGSAKELLLHEAPKNTAYMLYDIDQQKVVDRLKQLIEVKEKEELKIAITQKQLDKVKAYLIRLDLMMNCPEQYESGMRDDHYIFTQPGMRYSLAKALAYSLMQDESFAMNSAADKQHVIEKILEDVKGRMLEDIVLLETTKAEKKTQKAFKYKFMEGGEFDMVVYDSETDTCSLYEVKHSDQIISHQTRYLNDLEKCSAVERIYGRITAKYVLYRGKSCQVGDVHYQNVEEYLLQIGNH